MIIAIYSPQPRCSPPAGIVVLIFCVPSLTPHIGEVASACVACGVMGVAGNKGAVGLSMTIFRRRFIIVAAHLTAHQVWYCNVIYCNVP